MYLIQWWAAVQGTGTEGIFFAVFQNGIQNESQLTWAGGQNTGTQIPYAISGIVSAQAGDVFVLKTMQQSGSGEVIFGPGNFTIQKVA